MSRREQRVSSFEFRVERRAPASRLAPRNSRLGITLIEILISMFVLLFGLMGVAAIFPVASHYIVEGEKRDRGSGLAQIAFEELKSRKILRPTSWLYANYGNPPYFPAFMIDAATSRFLLQPNSVPSAGNAFVIDPLGCGSSIDPARMFFPIRSTSSEQQNPWNNLRFPTTTGTYVKPQGWPITRLTLSTPNSNSATSAMIPLVAVNSNQAETTFRLRDDLAVQQPEAGDRPSIQTWSQGTGGQLLSRQYTGDYSWLATVVPTRMRALEGLQPALNIKDEFYEVTTVVFYKRDVTPSASVTGSPGSERMIAADFLNSGELAIYDSLTDDPAVVDLAVDGIKPTNWIAVMGVHQTTGMCLMKWYKIMAIDDETEQQDTLTGYPSHGKNVRFVMVQGPEWPTGSYQNLRVAILPGAIDAYTRVMQIEQE